MIHGHDPHASEVSFEELKLWFFQLLENLDVHFDAEPFDPEGTSSYDYFYYRLETKAQEHWAKTRGCLIPQAQLRKAFFAAEYDRFRRARLKRRSWWRKLLGMQSRRR